MGRKTAEERVEKFLDKRFRRNFPGMDTSRVKARMMVATQRLIMLDEQTRAILNGERVVTVDYMKYLTFTRAVGKQERIYFTSRIPEEVKWKLLDKYQGWGCSVTILRKILASLFHQDVEGELDGTLP